MKEEKRNIFIKSDAGFTMVELLVSASVLMILFTFVLANFRTGQSSAELDIVLKQIISGISSVRNMALGGQVMSDGSYPDGGYGIHFDLETNPDQNILFFTLNIDDCDPKRKDCFYEVGNELAGGIRKFKNIEIIEICGTDDLYDMGGNLVTPCDSPNWKDLKHAGDEYLDIIFPIPGEFNANYRAVADYDFVGGIIESTTTGAQAYFYVSLISGALVGELL